MEVSFFFEELLGRKVEIVTPECFSPHIGPHILKEAERVLVATRRYQGNLSKCIQLQAPVMAVNSDRAVIRHKSGAEMKNLYRQR